MIDGPGCGFDLTRFGERRTFTSPKNHWSSSKEKRKRRRDELASATNGGYSVHSSMDCTSVAGSPHCGVTSARFSKHSKHIALYQAGRQRHAPSDKTRRRRCSPAWGRPAAT
eukprot:3866406-Prymnesium_polylepis.1